MTQQTLKFSAEELEKIDQADDLKISPFREDGVTYGTPTWIWEIVLDGELFVRAYYGTNSRWYGAAIKQKAGRIHAAGMVREVSFEQAPAELNHQIDEAYKTKYQGSPYLAAMISSRARAATVRILPKTSHQ